MQWLVVASRTYACSSFLSLRCAAHPEQRFCAQGHLLVPSGTPARWLFLEVASMWHLPRCLETSIWGRLRGGSSLKLPPCGTSLDVSKHLYGFVSED